MYVFTCEQTNKTKHVTAFVFFKGNLICTRINYTAAFSKPPIVFVRAGCRVIGQTQEMHHAKE